ncbi:MAG: hypothetical protein K0Q66_1045 [Chitinophagaceae bacterium]|jgi:hypothetical protein|nr:hypothetical protein [Chitinophagaceae bacterium]
MFCLTSFLLAAQDTTLTAKPLKTIEGVYTDFTTDATGNVYLVINGTTIRKVDNNGDSVGVFNDVKRYGKIHSVDASNPFKLLVFYYETSTIIVLDRFLNARQVIDLRQHHIQQAKAIRLSYDNNIWVYDEVENKIKKINDNGELLLESADLRNVFDQPPTPTFIFDDSRTLYLYDTALGWLAFDYYGAFQKKYAFTNWKDAQVLDKTLIGRDDSSNMFWAKAGDFNYTKKQSNISFGGALGVRFSMKHVYILYPHRLEIYEAP